MVPEERTKYDHVREFFLRNGFVTACSNLTRAVDIKLILKPFEPHVTMLTKDQFPPAMQAATFGGTQRASVLTMFEVTPERAAAMLAAHFEPVSPEARVPRAPKAKTFKKTKAPRATPRPPADRPAAEAPQAPRVQDPHLDVIVAQYARAAYIAQIQYLLQSVIQSDISPDNAAKLNSALTILNDDLAKLAG